MGVSRSKFHYIRLSFDVETMIHRDITTPNNPPYSYQNPLFRSAVLDGWVQSFSLSYAWVEAAYNSASSLSFLFEF
jgi:hypothetical protein